MRNTSLLTANQAAVFNREIGLNIIREKIPDFYNTLWFLVGTEADWTGFMDDFGDFIPVDWC